MYTIDLDISSEVTDIQVNEFATALGCTATLLMENGPGGGNPLYEFSSDNFDYLQELVEQYFGGEFDEEEIKNMIVEV